MNVGNGQLELVFAADRKVYDGRFANNGWLQELPGVDQQAHLGQRGARRAEDREGARRGRGQPGDAVGRRQDR